MRSSPRLTNLLLPLLLVGAGGCSTYNYMRDASPTLEQNRVSYTSSHPEGTFNDKILNGQVTKGMTRYEVLVAWGNPDFVRSRKVAEGGEFVDEMWKYREDESVSGGSTYVLTFAGDLLDDIEVDRGYSLLGKKNIDEVSANTELLPRDVGSKSIP